MPRTARLIVEGVPYHVTQRGNRLQDVFFGDDDRRAYLSYIEDYSERYGLDMLAYSLMTNHVHLVSIPQKVDSLALTLRAAHARYSQYINKKFGWSGHLWQGKYFSAALDDTHLWAAVRYVELNPVRAGILERAEEYQWSSAAFHVGLCENKVLRSETQWGQPMEEWSRVLSEAEDKDMIHMIRTRTMSGFPCGDEAFIDRLSAASGRELVLRGRGRPRKR